MNVLSVLLRKPIALQYFGRPFLGHEFYTASLNSRCNAKGAWTNLHHSAGYSVVAN